LGRKTTQRRFSRFGYGCREGKRKFTHLLRRLRELPRASRGTATHKKGIIKKEGRAHCIKVALKGGICRRKNGVWNTRGKLSKEKSWQDPARGKKIHLKKKNNKRTKKIDAVALYFKERSEKTRRVARGMGLLSGGGRKPILNWGRRDT